MKMNKTLSLLLTFVVCSSLAVAQNLGYTYVTGLPNSNSYPIKIFRVDDDWSKDMATLSNGKCYPILNRIVRQKGGYIGGTLENLTTKKKTAITDVALDASGKNDGVLKVSGTGFSMSMKTSIGAIASSSDDSMIFWDGKDYWKVTKKP